MAQQTILHEDVNRKKMKNLEMKIESQNLEITRLNMVEEEKNHLEKLLSEQQKIIRLALARILPNTNSGESVFCKVKIISTCVNSLISVSFRVTKISLENMKGSI